jgi:hypothetical protein
MFAGEFLLCARLRPANRDASAGAVEAIARIVGDIRTCWPTVRLMLRADSGFCRESLMAWCDAHGVDYVFGLAKNSRLLAPVPAELAAQAQAQYAPTGPPGSSPHSSTGRWQARPRSSGWWRRPNTWRRAPSHALW